MKLLVGLGNPGAEHADNRHNIGYKILAHWVASQKQRFQEKSDFRGLVAKVSLPSSSVVALLPLTYMNRSGEAVAKVMSFYKIPIEDVIVLHDELDIASCTFRVKLGGGHGGHNGLKSIHPLGEAYVRLRLGIGRPPHPDIDVADYVLGNFSHGERQSWENLYPSIVEAMDLCIAGKTGEAMNRFSAKPKNQADADEV